MLTVIKNKLWKISEKCSNCLKSVSVTLKKNSKKVLSMQPLKDSFFLLKDYFGNLKNSLLNVK